LEAASQSARIPGWPVPYGGRFECTCWGWLGLGAAVPAAGRDGRRLPWMPAVLLAPCIGLALNMLAAVMLAEAGLYTPMAEAGVLAALAGTGLVLGRARLRVLPHVPVALATLTAAMAAMWLPDRASASTADRTRAST
jgi:hypothetical protein